MKLSSRALVVAAIAVLLTLPSLGWANPPEYSRGLDSEATFTLQHPSPGVWQIVGDYYVARDASVPSGTSLNTILTVSVNGVDVASLSDSLAVPVGPPPSCGACTSNSCPPVKNGGSAFCRRLFALVGGSKCWCETRIAFTIPVPPPNPPDLVDGDDIALRVRVGTGGAQEPYTADDRLNFTIVGGQLQLAAAMPASSNQGLAALALVLLGTGALIVTRRRKLA